MKYQVAIPSYKRSETIVEKTLPLLTKYKISPDIVTIFVGNEEEKSIYKRSLSSTPYQNVVVGQVGIKNIRNFMRTYYPEGTKVMHFDDDLQKILRKDGVNKLVEVDDLEKDVIFRGFNECRNHGARIFGIYAAGNPFFMSQGVTTGLSYIIASCYGLVIRHDKFFESTIDDKEDVERSLMHYVKDGCLVRLDDITVKSNYYGEAGGMQIERTEARIRESAVILAKRYPHLCDIFIRKSTGHAELRLRDKRLKKSAK